MPHRECSRNIYWRFFYLSSQATYWRDRNRTCTSTHTALIKNQLLSPIGLHANRKDFYTMSFLRLSATTSISLEWERTTHALVLSSFVQGPNSAPYASYLHLCVSLRLSTSAIAINHSQTCRKKREEWHPISLVWERLICEWFLQLT